MDWFLLFFEPLVLIGASFIVVIILNKMDISVKYSLKVLYAGLIFYIIVATPLGANYLISRVEINSVKTECKNSNIDIVVILGGGIYGDPNSIDELWRLKEASYRRTLSGLNFAKRLNISKIIVSGGYGGQFTEADLMAALINKIGFTGQIIIDSSSKSTYTSAVNVTKILSNRNIENYWLVTSSLHMYRAESSFLKQGIKPCRFPVDSKYINVVFPGAILPQISALDKSTSAFHEIIGYIWYSITGKN